MASISPIVLIAFGLVLAFFGRRFLWLLVAIAGFVLGYDFVQILFPDMAATWGLLIGIVVGAAGAWLARRYLKLLLNIAAFILVASVGLWLMNLVGLTGPLWRLIAIGGGGLIGLGLMRWAFDRAIIIVSGLGGAVLVMQGLPLLWTGISVWLTDLIGLVVLGGGIFYQWREMRGPSQPAPVQQTPPPAPAKAAPVQQPAPVQPAPVQPAPTPQPAPPPAPTDTGPAGTPTV